MILFLTDQELDKETGLYNYDARLYDPITGEFVSADTVVQDWFSSQSLNRYAYCANNPLIYIDPSGHSETDADKNDEEDKDKTDSDGGTDDTDKNTKESLLNEEGKKALAVYDTLTGLFHSQYYTVDPKSAEISTASRDAFIAALVAAGMVEALTVDKNQAPEKTAPEIREENIKKGIPETQLGSSGKPKINVVKHSTLKKAKDAARARAGKGGTTVKHASPKMGKGHFHGLKQDGTKIRTHDEYPK